MVGWEKQNIMLQVLNFKKGVAHISIDLYEFSVYQIFKMKQSVSALLRKQQMHSCQTTWMI